MNTFATGSLPVHFSVAKLFNFRWQYTVDVYHNQMPYFRSFQSTVDDAPNRRRCLVFEIFGEMYMYNEHFENGLIESGQLDRIVHLDDSWETEFKVEKSDKKYKLEKKHI